MKEVLKEVLKEESRINEASQIVKDLPKELKIIIFSYTTEFARRYSKFKKFKKFGSDDNVIFPSNFFKLTRNLNPEQADFLWKTEQRLVSILKEKQIYINQNENRPCLQHSSNSSHDFKENIFPSIHEIESCLWSVNNYKQLISYTLKVTLSGFYTILFIKENHLNDFRTEFISRILNHHMNKYTREYIVYYKGFKNGLKKNFENSLKRNNIPKIICIPYNYSKIIEVYQYLKYLETYKIKCYMLTPESNNTKMNNLIKYFVPFVSGSGKYDF